MFMLDVLSSIYRDVKGSNMFPVIDTEVSDFGFSKLEFDGASDAAISIIYEFLGI
ncbi:hypothetical protein C5167_026295 [Papaver somniferum]|nr:hypothetical protein C5167_026295 [Papaver somniferum]